MGKQKTITIRSKVDDLDLSVLVSEPEGEQFRGVVQMLHGMCEYKERYLPLMEHLNGHGFACVIHDHRGHGGSVKGREDLGYMYEGGADGMIRDCLQVNDWIREQFPGVPVLLFGHSMGSLAARSFIKQYDDRVDGVVLSGPPSRNSARAAGTAVAALQKKLRGSRSRGKLLEKLSFGGYVAQCPESRCAWVCSDRNVVEIYEKDPLCQFTFTVDAYLVLFELMRRTYDKKDWKCSRPALPVLLLGGSDDPCIGGEEKFEEELDYLRGAGYTDVQGKLYTGMRHEICNETRKEVVYRDIVEFLQKKGF